MRAKNIQAVRTEQEVADILYARGVLNSPDRNVVNWYERSAFQKIRKQFPELADEIDSRKSRQL